MNKLLLIADEFFGDMPYAKERRSWKRRILGWAVAFLPGIALLMLWYSASASGAM